VHTDSNISIILLVLSSICVVALLVWSYRSVRQLIPRKHRYGLWILRAVGLVLILLLCLNPFFVEQHPDPEAFHVAVLGDLSGSMHLTDTQDQRPRVDYIRAALSDENPQSLFRRLSERYDTSRYTFADDLHANVSTDFSLMPGLTGIGQSLRTLLNQQLESDSVLGAVVLLSDGISLQGESMFDVAKAYRDLDIPITVIGIGEDASRGDMRVEFVDTPEEAPLGEPLQLDVIVANTFARDVEVEVGLFDRDMLVEQQTVQVQGNGQATVTFTAQPLIPGHHVYRTRILNTVSGDLNPTNDIDFAPILVTEPEVMKILYLSSRLTNDYRFLKLAVKEDAQFQLRSILRLGEQRILRSGFEDRLAESDAKDAVLLQDPNSLMDYSVLIIDTSVLQYLQETVIEGLKTYLNHRGGGILFTGIPEEVDADIRTILPVRQSLPFATSSRQYLELAQEPVFSAAAGGTLFTPPGLFLPKEEWVISAAVMSKASRSVLRTKAQDAAIMALQAYGAGRVIFLGTGSTWRWRMDSTRGVEQHRLFWRYLLGWLGAGGKPRLEMPIQGEVQSLQNPVGLDLTVRGQDFRLSEDARVKATVTTPSGEVLPPQVLVPEMLEPGVYTGATLLNEPGEYKVDYDIAFPQGEHLHRQAFFVGEFSGQENADLRFREKAMADIARITRGDYISYRDIDTIEALQVSPTLPMLQERVYWTRNWMYLVLIVCVFGMEWYLRRRIGLR